MQPVDRFRTFQALLGERQLTWALHFAPRHLRQPRSPQHPCGAALAQLLPPEYRAFVESVGYPVFALLYRDREGISFLPPEPMAVLSCTVSRFDEAAQAFELPADSPAEPAKCFYAFFAGHDLANVHGFAFGPSAHGSGIVVWRIEEARPVEECGPFDAWLERTLSTLTECIDSLTDQEIAEYVAYNAQNDASDPHRLLDYSLAGSYELPAYSMADLALSWVEDRSDVPFAYGLIDARGRWLLPLAQHYKRVRPFRAGVAEVILNVPGANYNTGPWTKIRIDGSPC